MTPMQEHHLEQAERLLLKANEPGTADARKALLLQEAQVHATLATVRA